MSTDYAGKEREFLATLAADTGRDLGAWMAEISAKGLADKNDIIDWLRREGFPFWKASWLERIHHNGGRPIYGDRPGADAAYPSSSPAAALEPDGRLEATPSPALAIPLPCAAAAPDDAAAPMPPWPPAPPPQARSLDELLARAKAFRPLAMFLMSAIERIVPQSQFAARGSHIAVGAPAEFAAIGISARDLRLGLALGTAPRCPGVERLRAATAAARLPPGMTHFAVLTDARQVNAELLAFVAAAHSAINGSH
jgi:uncharacterized protein DUF5655